MAPPRRQLTFVIRTCLRWAREIPYEKLNTLANEMFCSGEQLLPESSPRPEVSRRLFGKLSGLNAAPDNEVQPFYVFEYFPHCTVFILPEDATALVRCRYEMSPELAQR